MYRATSSHYYQEIGEEGRLNNAKVKVLASIKGTRTIKNNIFLSQSGEGRNNVVRKQWL